MTIKPMTITKAESLAAEVKAKIIKFVKEQLNLDKAILTAWTDSKCVLYWLKSINLDKKQRFIHNRIKTIKVNNEFLRMKFLIMKFKILIMKFRYVPSEDNPADIRSRGCTPNELKNNELWWSGPEW